MRTAHPWFDVFWLVTRARHGIHVNAVQFVPVRPELVEGFVHPPLRQAQGERGILDDQSNLVHAAAISLCSD